MAYESVAVTDATGTSVDIIVDTVSGDNIQAVKLDIGADGVLSGPVCTANPMPVVVTGTPSISGTVAVTNAGLTALNGAITGTEVQVDVLTMPTVTINSPAVTNAGTFATQVDGAALTALQLIDDVVFAEDAAHVSGDKGIPALVVRKDAAATIAQSDGDYTLLQTDSSGALRVTGGTSSTQYAEDAAHVSGDTGTMALVVRKDTGATIAQSDGDYTALQTDADGNLRVAIAADSVGSSTDTDDGTIAAAQASIALTLNLPYVFDGTSWVRGGYTPISYLSAATTNATNVKASAGLLGFCYVSNTNAAVRYIKFYDSASAPTAGVGTPLQRFAIPGSTTGAGFVLPIPDRGLAFSAGIGFTLTTGVADNDANAVALNEIIVNLGYK